MKIAVDISQIVYETGASVYTRSLVRKLLEIDHKNSYTLFAGVLRRNADIAQFFDSLKSSNVRKAVYPLSPTMLDLLWNKLHTFSPDLLIGRTDVFHASDWTQPPTSANKVTTIHDLAPVLFPQETDPKIVAVHNRRLKWVKKEADAIIVPSYATKNDLIDLKFDESKIHVIYEAAEDGFAKASSDQIKKVLRKYEITQPYYLMLGANKRKNVGGVIKAFELLKPNAQLVIAGRNTSEIEADNKNIKFLGHIQNNERSALYSGALSLVYPSLYEGFGLPILESFRCGCPVITSNVSSMAEIAGDAAILVTPTDFGSIAHAMESIVKSRSKYQKRGLLRARQFSWAKAAEETLEIYKNI